MRRHIPILWWTISALLIGLLFAGCNRSNKWKITFSNEGNTPASCYVTFEPDGKRAVEVKDFAENKSKVLVDGTGKTVVHSVVVKVKGKELPIAFTPDTQIEAGMHFSITCGDCSACTEIY